MSMDQQLLNHLRDPVTEDLYLGTTVRLRDVPGPLLRIIDIQDDQATVFWFDRHNVPHQHQFNCALLVRMPPFEPGNIAARGSNARAMAEYRGDDADARD
ncbi:hypothetical protein I6F35_33535 [Bradyrhizobium sp. BRP22]|uniref:hypothetical protein n=1 Tax=Bradyrhizobium sp. BRP22 TaxID=2793821 RepID=UPI001CD22723|nr:hypothetical protein [Bradyrhizobium sp. BRP22]MCA1458058.1 hypothetical protein [Bradyrhizobium sp. BRP22]